MKSFKQITSRKSQMAEVEALIAGPKKPVPVAFRTTTVRPPAVVDPNVPAPCPEFRRLRKELLTLDFTGIEDEVMAEEF